jgi:hypothetical protein
MSRVRRSCGTVYIMGTFSPDWWSLPRLKGQHLVLMGATTQNKRPSGPLVPVGGSNQDWKSTFSPGWNHRPGLNVPPEKACCTSRWARDSSPDGWLKPGLNHLLLKGPVPTGTKAKNRKSIFYPCVMAARYACVCRCLHLAVYFVKKSITMIPKCF